MSLLNVNTHRARSGPVFVRRGGETVAYVRESSTTVLQLCGPVKARRVWSRPSHVYIIDSLGVRRAPTRDPRLRYLLVAVLLLGFVLGALARKKR